MIMRPLIIFIIHSYQYVISPFLPVACRFSPTCSHYAAEAIERHGPGRGAWLAVKRILCCHPFGASGFDPVPDRENA